MHSKSVQSENNIIGLLLILFYSKFTKLIKIIMMLP